MLLCCEPSRSFRLFPARAIGGRWQIFILLCFSALIVCGERVWEHKPGAAFSWVISLSFVSSDRSIIIVGAFVWAGMSVLFQDSHHILRRRCTLNSRLVVKFFKNISLIWFYFFNFNTLRRTTLYTQSYLELITFFYTLCEKISVFLYFYIFLMYLEIKENHLGANFSFRK